MTSNGRLGALAERDFRLVFSSTTISAIGDGVAYIALAFAILHISHNSPTAVGVVLACRQGAAAAVTLVAGVIADRLPRHVVLVAVASVHGVDYLLTWNCKHLANAQISRKIALVCEKAGHRMPVICTPEELMGG